MKEKTDYKFEDAQVQKTHLLKSLEAQTHMFNSNYSCFVTLKFSTERGPPK